MKKVTIYSVIFFVVGAVLSPVIGMAIGETRNLILGLAPEEAVLELADKIDQNKEDNENKMQEMQTLIEQQKVTINEQSQKLLETKQVLENAPNEEEIKTIASDVTYCQTNASNYTPEKYKVYKEMPEKTEDGCIDKDSSSCEKAVNKSEKNFEEYKLKYAEYHNKCD